MAKKAKYEILNIDGTAYKTTLTQKFKNRTAWELPNENLIKAFIPGTILKIFVKEGQKVREGSKLLILEAMKMKNVVTAPASGVIKSIEVKEGIMVPKNQLLIEIE